VAIVSNIRFRRAPLAALAVLVLALSACAGTRFGGGASAEPSDAAPSAAASQAPASVEPSAPPSADASDGLGEFSCDFPMENRGTPVHSQLVGVRVGEHDGYDRVVFEFDGVVPEYILSQASPPYTEDPSGLPIEVHGDVAWQLVMLGGTRVTPDYETSYDGPFSFERDFTKLVHLVEAGDFEAVSTWYIGMSGASCARVLGLDDPTRLVIDIEH
jgi:hypothetical protein